MRTSKTKTVFFLLFFSLSPFIPKAYSQLNGEIINVSQQYKTAFADQGSGALTVGNILQIQTSTNATVYLQVVETNPGLSKLGFIDSGEYRTDPVKFSAIIVGNSFSVVSKDIQAPSKKGEIGLDNKDIQNSQFTAALADKEKEIADLKIKLRTSEDLLKTMRQQNSQLLMEKQIHEQDRDEGQREIGRLKEAIAKLREKLSQISQLTHPVSAVNNGKDRTK